MHQAASIPSNQPTILQRVRSSHATSSITAKSNIICCRYMTSMLPQRVMNQQSQPCRVVLHCICWTMHHITHLPGTCSCTPSPRQYSQQQWHTGLAMALAWHLVARGSGATCKCMGSMAILSQGSLHSQHRHNTNYRHCRSCRDTQSHQSRLAHTSPSPHHAPSVADDDGTPGLLGPAARCNTRQ